MELPDKQNQQPAKPKIAPVGTGAKKVERPATKRFFDFLFAENPKDMSKKVVNDVVVPQGKSMFRAMVLTYLDGMLFGGGAPPANIVAGTVLRGGITNYSAASTNNSMLMARQANASPQRSSGNYQDLLLPTQDFAEKLLAVLFDSLNQYRRVAVAELYEAAGITSEISDEAYGWTSLDGARISRRADGFLLELPRPVLIN